MTKKKEKNSKTKDIKFETIENKPKDTKSRRIWEKVLNIVFTIIIVIIAIITIDYVRVAKFEYTPLFAIKTTEYKDGGTTEYYGLGYKVIDYNQIQGRRDIEIGTWNLKHNSKPIDISDVDLAIEFTKYEVKAYNNYYKKFLRIKSTLKDTNEKTNTIILGYTDEDGKYSLDISCELVAEQLNIEKFEENKQITIIGTVKDYKVKTDKNNRRIYIKDCIAEQ